MKLINNSHPRITVLMSVYNGEEFLESAIDSILSQTYTDFEFVIYDDCSTDRTSEIIQSYNDSRIIYRRNSENRGLTWNLADGVARSQSDYIARMDADDISYPERFEKQLRWMDEHADISILGTSVTYFKTCPGDGGTVYQPEDDKTIKATLFISFTLMHPSIMIRRKSLADNHLNYNPAYRYSQDHVLYLDCIKSGLNFANMRKPLLYMRAHSGSISRAKHGAQQECSQRARFRFLKDIGLSDYFTKEEINAYNTFASGYYPDTIDKVHAYERFVDKVYDNPITSRYFDKSTLIRLMSEKLCGDAYEAVEHKKLKRSAIEARKSPLLKYTSRWTFKQSVKYYIKLIFFLK